MPQLAYLGHPNSLKARPDGAREPASSWPACGRNSTAQDVDAALDRVGILSRGDLPARSLSAGQKRRLALARLLLADAALWVLDEPVTNLDSAGVPLVEELVHEHVQPRRPGARGRAPAAARRLAEPAPAGARADAPRVRPSTAARLVFRRDMTLAWRRWDEVAQPLIFYVVVTTLFPLATTPDLQQLREISGGVVWVAALLSSLLALGIIVPLRCRRRHDGTMGAVGPAARLAAARQGRRRTGC